MCNLYSVGKNPNENRVSWEKQVREALKELPKAYGLRPTDSGVVVTGIAQQATTAIMRWGFKRPQSPAITNARGDNLTKRGMWAEAFQERRCLIVADCYYEFTGNKGAKQAHAFQRDDAAWMWIAGIWEENAALGPCYSMITTPPDPLTETIHDRMPAVLDDEQAIAFMQGEVQAADFEQPLTPPSARVITFPCANPLRMKREIGSPERDSGPVQQELF